MKGQYKKTRHRVRKPFDRIPKDNRYFDMKRWSDIPDNELEWSDFIIVVPDEENKKELQKAFEYFHDNRLIDTDYMAVSQLCHQYLGEEDGGNDILVDRELYLKVLEAKAKEKK